MLEKWQEDRLAKRLEIARQLYNTLLRYEIKKLRRFEQSPENHSIMAQITAVREEKGNDAPELKPLYKQLNTIRNAFSLTEYAFKSDIKRFYKHFNDNIGSNVAVHGIASQVWSAFDRLFFGDGKELHFKAFGELNSVRGGSYTNRSGGKEIMFRGNFIEWKGLKLPIKFDPDNIYETKMLSYRVKYCRILRKPGRNRSRWYVQLSLEGKPAVKYDRLTGMERHPVGTGAVGIDIGPQTIAYCSEKSVKLLELADKVQNIKHEIALIQRKMERSKRSTNPKNYNEDGTIKHGVKLTKNKSNRYKKLQHRKAYMQFQQSEIRKRQHNALANELMSEGDCFFVEDMAWKALTKRSKKTEISEKTGRYKRKKRFGKSIANKAPAALISLLDLKLRSRGYEGVCRIDTSVRASQYNHLTDEYVKKPLNQRWNEMPDGRRIQRDMYSAFLLQHMNNERNGFNRETLRCDYDKFVELHDCEIERIRSLPSSPSSMGVRRSVS